MYGAGSCKNDNYLYQKPAIHISLPYFSVTVVISNSYVWNMGQSIIYIDSRLYTTHNAIFINNCKFEDNKYINKYQEAFAISLMQITLSHFNATLTLSDCNFHGNQ